MTSDDELEVNYDDFSSGLPSDDGGIFLFGPDGDVVGLKEEWPLPVCPLCFFGLVFLVPVVVGGLVLYFHQIDFQIEA